MTATSGTQASDSRSQLVVVKIGSSSLVETSDGLSRDKLALYCRAVDSLLALGHKVVLVTSGAVASGFRRIGYPEQPSTVAGRRAAAAVGQGLLMRAYIEEFEGLNHCVAQVLLTRQDFSNRDAYNNALATLGELLARGVLPIINENDTVTRKEIRFGDNDILAALVATLLHADTLAIVTDTPGLFTADPRGNPLATRIGRVARVTPELIKLAGDASSRIGTGGMRAKLVAAKHATSLGVATFVGTSAGSQGLVAIVNGLGDGTYFDTEVTGSVARKKQWIAYHAPAGGSITVDAGARDALLHQGSSLLPAGVVHVEGEFDTDQVVHVVSISEAGEKQLLGKGVVNHSSRALKDMMGRSTSFLRSQFQITRDEVVHRDNWVTLYEHSA